MASGANSSSYLVWWGNGGLCGVAFLAKNDGGGMASSYHSISTRHWWGVVLLILCVHSMPAEEGKIDLSKVIDYYCV